jgi:hypothetical protein
VLIQRAEHARRLWLIPVFAAVWANVHGSFPLVLVLVGLAWLDEVTLLREPTPAGHSRPRLQQRLLGSTGVAIIGAFSALATLINPFGIDVWRYVEDLARNQVVTSQVSEWRPPSPLDPAGAVFYLSLAFVIGVIAFRLRTDRGRPPLRFLAPIATVLVFGTLGVLTGRGLAWWALTMPLAVVSLQPGLKLADVRVGKVQPLRARTAREASAAENRRSPLNAVIPTLLLVFGIALLPLWRPAGPAGVPLLVLTEAPQGIAAYLGTLTSPSLNVWNPQAWGSWLEFAAPQHRYAVDARIELFPAELWTDVEQVAAADGDWQKVLINHGVTAVVVAREDRALADALAASGTWERVHEDSDGSVWRAPTSD